MKKEFQAGLIKSAPAVFINDDIFFSRCYIIDDFDCIGVGTIEYRISLAVYLFSPGETCSILAVDLPGVDDRNAKHTACIDHLS
ncbi:hypothetical protein [Marispirochaeta sp.]|uniref:hypothetical protein n=1 Tax=Marispirochaeta sp. TaxID=2038653 RepID=UPI0029C76E16|nr:hypothetical protein [Marispirochaeta sp.]